MSHNDITTPTTENAAVASDIETPLAVPSWFARNQYAAGYRLVCDGFTIKRDANGEEVRVRMDFFGVRYVGEVWTNGDYEVSMVHYAHERYGTAFILKYV